MSNDPASGGDQPGWHGQQPYPGGYGQQQPPYNDPYEQQGYPGNGYQQANGYAAPATVPPPYHQQQQRLRHLLTVDGSQQWLELHVGSNAVGRGQERVDESDHAGGRDAPGQEQRRA